MFLTSNSKVFGSLNSPNHVLFPPLILNDCRHKQMLCTRQLKFYTVTGWNGKRVTVFAITIGAGDSIIY